MIITIATYDHTVLGACEVTKMANDEKQPRPQTPVDIVIDALDKRSVGPVDRSRLREAVDRADAPQKGRAGADERLGRAINR